MWVYAHFGANYTQNNFNKNNILTYFHLSFSCFSCLWKERFTAMEQAVACAPVTQRTRVLSPVRTSFLGEVFSGFFLTCKTCQEALGPQGPRIKFGRHNHPFIFTLLEWMGEWMVCIIFHVCVISEVAPALSLSLIRGGPPCPCVVKKVCMWSIV